MVEGKPRQRVPPCGFCRKEFKRQEHLERHLRTHTKERPYKCDICERRFTRQDLLHRHHRLGQCNTASSAVGSVPLVQRRLAQGQNPPFHVNEHVEMPSQETHQGSSSSMVPSGDGDTAAMYFQGQQTASFEMLNSAGERSQPISGNVDDNFAVDSIDASGLFGLQPLEMDFLFDEAGMINDHLAQDLPPLDYGLSPAYSDPLSHMNNLVGSHRTDGADLTSPGLVEQGDTTLRESIGLAHPRASSPGIARDRSGRQHLRSAQAPSLEDIDEMAPKNPWDVSEDSYARLSALFSEHRDPSDPFRLPSRRTVSRYVASWARSYHPHLPVLHLPTKNFDYKSSMLLLTLAAVGSFYVFEHSNGYPMLVVAKSVVLKRLQARQQRSSLHLLVSVPNYAKVSTRKAMITPRAESQQPEEPFDIELLQSLLIIVMSLAWLDKPFTQEGLALSSQLAELTREALRDQNQPFDPSSWEAWAQEEERRRTIYSAYFTLNLLTICFKVPPPMPSSEITLPLPSPEAEFRAVNAEAWQALRGTPKGDQLLFSQCFKQLLHGRALPKGHGNTEFGNYMLMQSLLAHIYFERQGSACLFSSPLALHPSVIALYDASFNAWQSGWDLAMESALDPSSFRGPLAFNSTAMLRLAHVHLAIDIPAQCTLAERDPAILAQAFDPDLNLVQLRSPHLHQGIMHAIKALRIPIRVGIAFVASGRTGHWSVQHAISNFYCALLLTHWLESIHHVVAKEGTTGLSREEKYCLLTVERLVEETHLEGFLGPKKDYPDRIRRVAISALRLWAETCKGTQVYEIVFVIGETLARAADELEDRESD